MTTPAARAFTRSEAYAAQRMPHLTFTTVAEITEIVHDALMAAYQAGALGESEGLSVEDAIERITPEESVRGCSCGMADYGAPGHDGAVLRSELGEVFGDAIAYRTDSGEGSEDDEDTATAARFSALAERLGISYDS